MNKKFAVLLILRKSAILLSFLFPVLVNSLPMDLNSGWFIKNGKHLSFGTGEEKWIRVEKLPARIEDLKITQDKKIISFTAYKNFNLKKNEIPGKDQNISILIPFIYNVFEIYFNGELLYSRGIASETEIRRNGYKRNINVVLPERLLREKRNEIFIQMTGNNGGRITLYGGKNFLIDLHENNLARTSERITLMLAFFYFAAAAYHLLLFIKRSKEKYNLYFALFAFQLSTYIYMRSNAIYELDLDPFLTEKIEFCALFPIGSVLLLFFEDFLNIRVRYVTLIYLCFTLVLVVLEIFATPVISPQLLKIWQISALAIVIYFLYIIFRSAKERNRDAFRLLAGLIILLTSAVLDILGAMSAWGMENYELVRFGFLIFVTGIATVLANRFLRVHNEVEELNTTLERKVEERTRELQNTLDEVKSLKVQQDGDYFLTSLLIEPLGQNRASGSFVSVDFFVKQKKRFEFRLWTTEIGGDLCIAHNIRLQEKNYTVFLNGDAMGKSIQGAGGALVLGVVFNSFVARTEIFSINRDKYPEHWLKYCFQELQNIFESFDGSMLVSVVIGMVEDATGMMYYINAEHPWCVLYRDKKASFLDDGFSLHKVGMMGMEGDLIIQTFQMEPGDVVIIGSDGRDDVLIGQDEEGNRIINEDEYLFLTRVEEGEGKPEKISEAIGNFGELTDDLTLMRIGYLENTPEEKTESAPWEYTQHIASGKKKLSLGDAGSALKEFEKAISMWSSDPEILLDVTKLYLREKNYERAGSLAEKGSLTFPSDSEFIYLASVSCKMNGAHKKSADLGERLKLRDPKDVRNLINLADTYRLSGNHKRAIDMLQKALRLEPENINALKLQKILDALVESSGMVER